MKGWLTGLWLMLLVAGCGGGDGAEAPPATAPLFTAMGLDGRIVYRLQEIDGELYAATDRGFYRHRQQTEWQLLGEQGWRIMDWAYLGEGRWLLSTADGHDYEPISRYELVASEDNGLSWQAVVHDFGGPDGGDVVEPINAMTVVDGRLLAVGYLALAESADGGHSWQLLNGLWQGFARGMDALTASPDGSRVWYGGQGAMEDLMLVEHRLGADAVFHDLQALLPNPSTVKGIRYHPEQSERLFVAGEGGIVESRDDGQSWQAFNTNPDYRFYFDLAFDPERPQRYFTAGWSKIVDTPQPLILEVSSDDGASWQRYQHPDSNLFGGVYSLMSRQEQGETVVYLGLFKGGVVRVSAIPQ